MGCRATGMSRRCIAQLKCRSSEKSRKWDVAQLKRAQMEYRAKKCRAKVLCSKKSVIHSSYLSFCEVGHILFGRSLVFSQDIISRKKVKIFLPAPKAFDFVSARNLLFSS